MKYKLFVLFVQFQSLQLVIVPISCQRDSKYVSLFRIGTPAYCIAVDCSMILF